MESPSPKLSSYDRGNFLSRVYCWYMSTFLFRYYGKDFNLEAIGPCPLDDRCNRLGTKLDYYWQQELAKKKTGGSRSKPSLVRAIFRCFGLQFLWQSCKGFFSYGILRTAQSLILGRVIYYSNRYFEDVSEDEIVVDDSDLLNMTHRQSIMLYSGLLCVIVFANFFISHPYYMGKFRYGMDIRVAVSRLIYAKALRITTSTVQRSTIGKIVNLISNDVNRFDIAYIYLSYTYLGPLITIVSLFAMYQFIQWSCLGSLAIIAVYIPFQTLMANILSRFRSASITLTDDRLRLMAEILPAMRVIKMYVWEIPFSHLVHVARKLEISKIRQSMILRSINLALYFISSKVMSFICLIIFLLTGGQLNAVNVFVTLSLIANIREIMTFFFPNAISYGVEVYISIKRIEKFLLEEEIEDYPKQIKYYEEDDLKKIKLNHVTVQSDIDTNILKDISFEVVPEKLTVIIGPVGSGKSSILLSILNELPTSGNGNVSIGNGSRICYVSQEAWIFNGTVRDNILFGLEFDSSRYSEVVKMASLTKDFQQFDNGDKTMVDDRGTSLSGGQRARISLARALYTDSDCYLLDDPLSAVDASVAKHIFEQCIKEYLRSKCVILVTHQLQYIKQADHIVVMKDGACFAQGSYIELLNQGIDIFKYSVQKEQDRLASPTIQQPSSPSSFVSEPRFRVDSFTSQMSRISRTSSLIESETDSIYGDYMSSSNMNLNNENESNNKAVEYNLESAGDSSGSSNKLKIYWKYITAGSGVIMFLFFALNNILTEFIFTGTDYWLSAWTDYQEKHFIESTDPNYTFFMNPLISREEHINIITYSGLVVGGFVLSIIRTVTYFVICMNASVNLHNRIFSSLIQAPIVFFDKTPIGIIMNRVSRDLGIIDDLLPPTAFEAIDIIGSSIGIFILCAAMDYWIIIPLLAIFILIYLASRFYVSTARKLKRLEGVARSPLLNLLTSTLNGLTTIRSYSVEQMLRDKFDQTQDQHTSSYYSFVSASRLYGEFLELVCVAYIVCLILIINLNLNNYNGSVVGLTISQSLMLTNYFNWGIRQYTEVETYMTSVERIIEFGQLEKEELECNATQTEPPKNWPSTGEVVYENVTLIYENTAVKSNNMETSKAVLKNLSFHIKGGEKIGIVGRTGAGKSSLITTLFRLTQPSGSIRIDGIDTGNISLATLRRALSIIPQEPILFSGNIRRNLDPFNEKSDDELWLAIDKVQLKSKIQALPGLLNSPVSECGSDFSVGQKQLICLARAILRKNRVLILDEATANVDPHTDSLIQHSIRTEFSNCTVLTIAHRLNTIIDYDRVMVLDAGELMQFDSPYNLIEARSGIFFELYNNLTQDSKYELKRLAKNAFMEQKREI